ncbi:glycine cleavage system protein GcvH [Streptomyces sp. LaPpAH-108]|uniref:glycine cleavage system protein GcvH n=1 Tax=Streptomyces sp. LaPpAH-108 TaxID=1155714 RepID=UPI00036CE28F|nr:glycine cleavage system protein GcvH [Streptomyces sp. LaPpAH-108]
MSDIPSELRYADSHEWLRTEEDGAVTIGLTDHAQTSLGDVVFVELPAVGKILAAGDPVGTVESVKAASEFYAPVGGEVIAVNDDVSEEPELVNEDPYGTWLVRLKPSDASERDKLLDAAGYKALIGE